MALWNAHHFSLDIIIKIHRKDNKLNKSPQELEIKLVQGADLLQHLPDLARLRLQVFRDFPYLYAGDLVYEQNYLQVYANTPDCLVVLVLDGEVVVGASSCLPMLGETDEVRQPLSNAGIDLTQVLYLGESVLLPEYRGKGFGHVFFNEREKHAQALGLSITAFCAVQRATDHPLRPNDYRPLAGFWRQRGYRLRSDLLAWMTWQDIDEAEPSAKSLQFWLRSESGTAFQGDRGLNDCK